MTTSDIHRTIEAVWRIESARLIGGLVRFVHDVGMAEDLAQDALVIALERWPQTGIPDNPGAWLMAIAKHRAIDRFRRLKLSEAKQEELGRDLEIQQELSAAELDDALDQGVEDDVLRVIFIACHPVLSAEARVALSLRLLGGLTTEEIARVSGAGDDGRPADRASKADAAGGAGVLRGPRRSGARRPSVVGARGDLPHLQRGLFGDRG